MSTIRGVKDRRFKFVQLLNEMFEDKELSLKAKGFIGYCLTKTEDWEFHVSHLCKVLKEGEDCIHTIIKECISMGYAYRYRPRSINGQLLTMVTIISDSKYEIECTKKELAESPEFKNSLPQRGFPAVGKPHVENPPPSNKDHSNTKKKEDYYCADQPVESPTQEKTPAAGNNNSSAKKQEKKIYPCLQELDIFAHTKKSITAQHTEEQVQYATQLLTHKDSIYHGKGTKESSMLLQDALNRPGDFKDTIDNLGHPKLTKQQREAKEREITQSDNQYRKVANRKWVKTQSGFEHGKTYSLWKCEIKDDAIWFSKKNGWSACVHYIEKDFMKLLDEHLKHLDIAIPNI